MDPSQAVFDSLAQHTFALFTELVNYALECAAKPKNARLQRITEYNQVSGGGEGEGGATLASGSLEP
jgi:hypothetical protein